MASTKSKPPYDFWADQVWPAVWAPRNYIWLVLDRCKCLNLIRLGHIHSLMIQPYNSSVLPIPEFKSRIGFWEDIPPKQRRALNADGRDAIEHVQLVHATSPGGFSASNVPDGDPGTCDEDHTDFDWFWCHKNGSSAGSHTIWPSHGHVIENDTIHFAPNCCHWC